jgi:hypothetical protein
MGQTLISTLLVDFLLMQQVIFMLLTLVIIRLGESLQIKRYLLLLETLLERLALEVVMQSKLKKTITLSLISQEMLQLMLLEMFLLRILSIIALDI